MRIDSAHMRTYTTHMDFSQPSSPFLQGAEAAVVEVLSRSDGGLTGRQLARIAKIPESTCRLALGRLSDLGLAHVRGAGRAHLFSLNRSHISWPTAESAITTRTRLFERYTELVQAHGDEIDLILFGSTARQDATPDSDVDLLLVTPDDLDATDLISALGERTYDWTGNHAQVYALARSEFLDHVASSDPIVASWRRDGIALTGRSIDSMMRSVA